VGWHYQLAEARQRDDVTLLLVNPKLQDGSLFDFQRVQDNFRTSHQRFADNLQNVNLALTLGVR
jgi:hypothetical protein